MLAHNHPCIKQEKLKRIKGEKQIPKFEEYTHFKVSQSNFIAYFKLTILHVLLLKTKIVSSIIDTILRKSLVVT